MTDALGNTTSYRYDAFGELISTIDPKGNTTALAYDPRGNKTSETTALGFTTIYQYDNNGNVVMEKNGTGNITTVYDRDNRPVGKTYSDGNVKKFSYDSLGRLTGAGDNFSSYYYAYDNDGNLTARYDLVNNMTITYSYDNDGNRTGMSEYFSAGGGTAGIPSNAKNVIYRYDALNRVILETAMTGATTNLQVSYSYSAMGRLTNKAYSTGMNAAYRYDAVYRLTDIINTTNGLFLSSFGYAYDSAGNRVKETAAGTDTNGNPAANVSTFAYDRAYRLTAVNYGAGGYEEYSYDNAGNRTGKSSHISDTNAASTAYVYDNDNRLLCEQNSSGDVAYTYDSAGRIVMKTCGGRRETYKYDQRDLLLQYTLGQDGNIISVSEYKYDVNNLRVQKTETPRTPGSMGEITVSFSYDGDNILTEGPSFYLNNITVNGYEAKIDTLRTAVYIKDALGSVRGELYDHPIIINTGNADSGTSTAQQAISMKQFNYTAFGEWLCIGSDAAIKSDIKRGIGFTGQYFDKDTNLYYSRARFYDPSAGRFMTTDPISDPSRRYAPAGLNRYVYCYNRPLYYTDPEGQWYIDFGIFGIGNDDDTGNFIFGFGIPGIGSYTFQQDSSGKISSYESFIGYNIANETIGVGYDYTRQSWYDEEQMSISAQYYCFNAGVTFYHKKMWKNQESWTDLTASAGVGYQGLGVGGEYEIDDYTNGQGQITRTSDVGVYAGYYGNDTQVGFTSKWYFNMSGQYTGMSIGMSADAYGASLGTNGYWDAQGNYLGNTYTASYDYYFGLSQKELYIGLSLTWGTVNGNQILEGSGGLYFNPSFNLTNMANAEATRLAGGTGNTTAQNTGSSISNEQFNAEYNNQQVINSINSYYQIQNTLLSAGVNAQGYVDLYGGLDQQKAAYQAAKIEAIQNGTLPEFLKDQLKEYHLETINGNKYYVAVVDGITFRMSTNDVSAPLGDSQPWVSEINYKDISWTGNSPIDIAIEGLNGKTLEVLIDAAHKNNVDEIEVSSMYRNNPLTYGTRDPHLFGKAIDVSKVWQYGEEYDFSHNVIETSLQQNFYSSLQEDIRVNQLFDPWQMMYNHGDEPKPNLGRPGIEHDHYTHMHIGIY